MVRMTHFSQDTSYAKPTRSFARSIQRQAYSVFMAIETPGSNGAVGPTLEVAATTFPHAPRLIMVEAARAEAEPTTVVVRYRLSEVS